MNRPFEATKSASGPGVLVVFFFFAACPSNGFGQDEDLSLLQEATSKLLPELTIDRGGFDGSVTDVAFSADNRLLAASGEKVARVWDVKTGALLHTLRGQRGVGAIGGVRCIAFSPDSQFLATGVLGENGDVRIYRLGSPSSLFSVMQVLPVEFAPVRILWLAERRYLVVHGESIQPGRSDQIVVAIDFQSPARRTLRYQAVHFLDAIPSSSRVLLMADGNWQAFDIATGQAVPAAETVIPIVRPSLTAFFEAAQATPENKYGAITIASEHDVAVIAQQLRDGSRYRYGLNVWSLKERQTTGEYMGHRYFPGRAAVSNDGKLIASFDDLGEVHLWDSSTQQLVRKFGGRSQPIYDVGIDSAGTRLAFGSRANSGTDWKINRYAELSKSFELVHRQISNSGESEGLLQEVTTQNGLSLTIRQPGTEKAAVILTRGSTQVAVIEMTADSPVWTCGFLKTPPGSPMRFAFGDGNLLRVYEFDGTNARSLAVCRGHSDEVMGFAESANQKHLITCGKDGTVRMWAHQEMQETATVGGLDVFPDDGRVLQVAPELQNQGVRVDDVVESVNGITPRDFLWRHIMGNNPFEIGDEALLGVKRSEESFVVRTSFVADPLRQVPLLLSLYHDDRGEWVLWTPEGYFDASANGARLIGWHINKGWDQESEYFSVDQFEKHFYRPDVIDEVLRRRSTQLAIEHVVNRPGRVPAALDLRNPADFESLNPPRVTIVSPAEGTTVHKASIEVEFTVARRQSGAEPRVVLLANGRPSGPREPERVSDDSAATLTYRGSLTLAPGKNEITGVASTGLVDVRSPPIRVNYIPDEPPPQGKLYLLAVGISEFVQSEHNLGFPHLDAKAFAEAWKTQAGTLFEDVETRVLLNQDATKGSILDAFDWLVDNCTVHDTAVLFVASHGARDERSNYYFIPHDVDIERLRSTGIRWSEIQEMAEDVPGKLLLFADTCHSGAILGGIGSTRDPLRDLASAEVGVIVFSSSLPRELSLEHRQWQHGAYTRAFLDTIKTRESDLDEPDDGFLSVSELQFNLSRRVKQLTRDRQHPVCQQPPTLSDFNLFRLNSTGE